MMFCTIKALDYYSVRWWDLVFPHGFLDNILPDPKARSKAYSWWKRSHWCFALAMLAFIVSSTVVAWALSNSTPPQATVSAIGIPASSGRPAANPTQPTNRPTMKRQTPP
jgi:hypothetical protein